jgi:hypothetical protein
MKKGLAMLLALGLVAQAKETKTEERQIPVAVLLVVEFSHLSVP